MIILVIKCSTMSTSDNDSDVSEDGISLKIDSKGPKDFNTNADVEWKFSRAVVAEEYRRCHPIIVPFNILTVPFSCWYIRRYGDMREKRAQRRREAYQTFYDKELFPNLTKRYKEKHGGSFPMSVEGKVDFLQKNFREILKRT